MAHEGNRTATGTIGRNIISFLEPWYDWGKIGVERMESLRRGQTPTDGEVRFSNCNGWVSTSHSRSVARRKGADDVANLFHSGGCALCPLN